MSMDRLSNMLSALKNASMAGKPVVEIMYSKECEEVAKVLREKGFLESVKVFKPEKTSVKRIHIELAKADGIFTLTETRRVSKPGRRIYRGADEIGTFKRGFGVMVVSTSKGIMSSGEARKKKIGGEILCEVY
ncbi:TPA: 30S ribosomal protein S8 [candidate division WWE3 bacterium]|uniref:Small ribosomal subunit protein uS8 n=2 Tax=Bacteria TaxID=2 RepID=A0A0H4TD46_9BACT|nr:30S ribosomal protein S8, small subunit ribosomal protein S8 [uncultured bacterium Rifle_16ft_4_minimus_8052]KKS30132.1 MAG: 30S ribosomal protein S8 [candidate division WWE3 bacterium GW2011_GWB1_42_117]KKS55181.1 MAG: 30S ribosomal protein S8 [candidate division WWE3 bacterium GW2011_GWD2_42_34]KKT05732.1 MAG: 30S ribosomal protein S8 [candidate division WWE3 bacterium GW2011_GWE2_43_18]KKT07378.1 MAG: 30S ribosomal protein S8 [candidate division WWE3 bacterium GW2011_GWF2_43_18]KKT08976.